MNYKKILKSQKLRFSILRLLSFIPDSIMVRFQYWIKLGRLPNLKNPQRFTEKLQCYKLFYRNPLMGQCVDKFEVRNFVENKGLYPILNEIYGGGYYNANEINFNTLPNKFVVKTTNGGGGNNVFICTDKQNLDIPAAVKTINGWLKLNPKRFNPGREWAYTQIKKPRIFVEKFLDADNDDGGLKDYKFFCFNGKVKYLYVIRNRNIGKGAFLGIYDVNFNKIDAYRCDEGKSEVIEEKPKNYEKMIMIAEKLSENFPHVRVDLYNIDGQIIFGELTFYDGSGYMRYTPDSFDFELGKYFTEY